MLTINLLIPHERDWCTFRKSAGNNDLLFRILGLPENLWVTGKKFVDLAKIAKHAKNTTRETPVIWLVWKKSASGFTIATNSFSTSVYPPWRAWRSWRE
jgi:hypothetical protein